MNLIIFQPAHNTTPTHEEALGHNLHTDEHNDS